MREAIGESYLQDNRQVAEALAGKRVLTLASQSNTLRVFGSSAVYRLLVIERAWLPEQFERWLASSLTASLLGRGKNGSISAAKSPTTGSRRKVIKFSELKGWTVVNLEQAKKIGTVDDLIIEPESHRIVRRCFMDPLRCPVGPSVRPPRNRSWL